MGLSRRITFIKIQMKDKRRKKLTKKNRERKDKNREKQTKKIVNLVTRPPAKMFNFSGWTKPALHPRSLKMPRKGFLEEKSKLQSLAANTLPILFSDLMPPKLKTHTERYLKFTPKRSQGIYNFSAVPLPLRKTGENFAITELHLLSCTVLRAQSGKLNDNELSTLQPSLKGSFAIFIFNIALSYEMQNKINSQSLWRTFRGNLISSINFKISFKHSGWSSYKLKAVAYRR